LDREVVFALIKSAGLVNVSHTRIDRETTNHGLLGFERPELFDPDNLGA